MKASQWFLYQVSRQVDGGVWQQFYLINCPNDAKAERITVQIINDVRGDLSGCQLTQITVSQASFLALLGIQIRRE